MWPLSICVVICFIVLPHHFSKAATECRRSNPTFNKCVADQMNGLRATLKKGLPHLQIGSLDPFYVAKISLKQGNGPVSIDLTATDQIFRGISNYNIESAKINLKDYTMEFTVSLPWLFVEGKSKIEGRMLSLPIVGSGDGWSNYTEVTGKAILKGHPIRKENKEYLKLDSVKFDMFVKRAVLHMNNLFNGNQQLGDAMNKFMSENWEVVFQELKPVIDQTVEEMIKDIATKLFKRYSLDDMFPK